MLFADPLPTPEARELMQYMSALSEEAYCAGWMAGLEYELWDAVMTGPRKYGRLAADWYVVNKLRNLSKRCGGWIVFDDAVGQRWLPLNEWRKRFAEQAATTPRACVDEPATSGNSGSNNCDKELHEALDAVEDEQTFLKFVDALVEDRRAAIDAERNRPSSGFTSDAGGWENTTIEQFLEAAVAWARDSSFGARRASESNVWQRMAEFLYAGKFYE